MSILFWQKIEMSRSISLLLANEINYGIKRTVFLKPRNPVDPNKHNCEYDQISIKNEKSDGVFYIALKFHFT